MKNLKKIKLGDAERRLVRRRGRSREWLENEGEKKEVRFAARLRGRLALSFA